MTNPRNISPSFGNGTGGGAREAGDPDPAAPLLEPVAGEDEGAPAPEAGVPAFGGGPPAVGGPAGVLGMGGHGALPAFAGVPDELTADAAAGGPVCGASIAAGFWSLSLFKKAFCSGPSVACTYSSKEFATIAPSLMV